MDARNVVIKRKFLSDKRWKVRAGSAYRTQRGFPQGCENRKVTFS